MTDIHDRGRALAIRLLAPRPVGKGAEMVLRVSVPGGYRLCDGLLLDVPPELLDEPEPEPVPQYSQREMLVIQTAAQFSVGDSTDDFNLCIASARRMLDAFDASREAQS